MPFCYVNIIFIQELSKGAPVRLVQLEFKAAEEKLVENLNEAEMTLAQQRQALENKANVKDILRKHKVSDGVDSDVVMYVIQRQVQVKVV